MTDNKVNSHEFAYRLRKLAEFLESRPQFPIPSYKSVYEIFSYYEDKAGFITAAKAIGSATKGHNKDEFWLETDKGDFTLRLRASRSAVCRKVQDEIWECEPLLSPDELASIGAA